MEENLFIKKECGWKGLSDDKKNEVFQISDNYMSFLNVSKTERAFIKNAPILVLDEATSALDSESEALIQDALKNLMKNRTSIVVAHRLSTIAGLDEIVVLNEGKVVEQGTHKKLLVRKGEYAKLWSRQSGAFLDDKD